MASPTLGSLRYEEALAVAAGSSVLGSLWLYWWDKRTRPGMSRLLVALPVVGAYLVLPALFSRTLAATTIILLCFNNLWLANFKILQWIINRGPLTHRAFTPLQFIAVGITPITPKISATVPEGTLKRRGSRGRLSEEAGTAEGMAIVGLSKFITLALVVSAFAFKLPPFVRSFLYSLGLYALLTAVMDAPGALITGVIKLKISPHFDQPWLSNSVRSFWSKRWDLAAGNTLRQLIFDPIVEGRLISDDSQSAPQSARRQLIATFTSFLVSGCVHELIFWYVSGSTTKGLWLSFFLIQPVAMVIESRILSSLKKRDIIVPNIVRISITVAFELIAGHLLFWGPVESSGVSDLVVTGVRQTLLLGIM